MVAISIAYTPKIFRYFSPTKMWPLPISMTVRALHIFSLETSDMVKVLDIINKITSTSRLDFHGIEDIEGISDFEPREKQHNKYVQTDFTAEEFERQMIQKPIQSDQIPIDTYEFLLLEKNEQIKQLQFENAQQKDQKIVLR
jgi:hypothetical protein